MNETDQDQNGIAGSPSQATPVGALSPYRVVDLTDEQYQLCGALLASLGAEVIVIEPPGGCRSRHLEPQATGMAAPEAGLWHWSFNRGKRSVVIDTASGDSGALRLLIGTADVLLVSGRDTLDRWGLDARELETALPRLVHVTMTAFGSDGPAADDPATDLTVAASAGVLRFAGDDDRAPVRLSVPQAAFHGALDAAAGAMLALYGRGTSGLGQHVDISAQQSFTMATQSQILADVVGHPAPQRAGGANRVGTTVFRNVYACADGHASVLFMFGAPFATANRALLDWALSHGFGRPELVAEDWATYRDRLLSGEADVATLLEVFDVLEGFIATRTKAELLDAALEHRLVVAPFTTTTDVMESEQLEARRYWESVGLADGREVRLPSAWVQASATPVMPLGPPPMLGADTAEVLGELTTAPAADAAAVAPMSNAGSSARPLEGVKVLDFMWVMAGPAASRVLADAGATVVRIESAARPDPILSSGPFKDGIPGIGRSTLFQDLNAGKESVTIDLSHPEAPGLVHDLVRWADVVCESFSGGAFRRLGYGYDQLRAVNPRIVMASSCLMGQTGPHTSLAGYGTMAAAVVGFGDLIGWSDRDPVGPYGAYTDYTSPRFLVTAITAALDHRRRTGEGQYLDLAQSESSLMLLAPALLEAEFNGVMWGRRGNRDRDMAPHGVFACDGDDDWVAVACRDDADWSRLATVIGRPDLAALSFGERRAREDELDAIISSWTSGRDVFSADAELRDAAVPAHAVARSFDCFADAQLQAREHFRMVPSASYVDDEVWIEGPRIRLSRTPLEVDTGAPVLGHHTRTVLTERLSHGTEEVDRLDARGVLR